MAALLRRSLLRNPRLCWHREFAAGAVDYYSLLGITSSASADEVKAAYRREALKWHPDRHAGSSRAAAEERFKLVSAAYQALSDPGERQAYDARSRHGAQQQQPWAQQQQRQPWQQQQQQQAWGGSAGAQEWSTRGGAQGMDPRQAAAEAAAAFELFTRLFGNAASVQEVLRRAAMQGRVVETLHVRANGDRVLRRTTTRVAPDGRLVREVEEIVLGERRGQRPAAAAPAPSTSMLSAMLRNVLLPFAGALLARFAEAAMAFVRRRLAAAVRRLFGR